MTSPGFIMLATREGRTSVDKARPFNISKREVWLAYKRVRENRGAAGVDDQTIAEFEKDLSNNLALESNVVGQLHAATGSSS